MKIIIKTLFFATFITVLSCNNKPDNLNAVVSNEEKAAIDSVRPLSQEDGTTFLKNNCYSCHNPNSVSHDAIAEPPLAGIKAEYKDLYTDRSTAIARMTEFVGQPSKGNALMKGPVRRFGLMPPVALDKKTIREIVTFIYDTPIDAPAWFPAHYEEEHGRKWVQ